MLILDDLTVRIAGRTLIENASVFGTGSRPPRPVTGGGRAVYRETPSAPSTGHVFDFLVPQRLQKHPQARPKQDRPSRQHLHALPAGA